MTRRRIAGRPIPRPRFQCVNDGVLAASGSGALFRDTTGMTPVTMKHYKIDRKIRRLVPLKQELVKQTK